MTVDVTSDPAGGPYRLQPFALRDAPALIEAVFPAQKVSFEAQREHKAGAGQTLASLGSYWKGRRPMIPSGTCRSSRRTETRKKEFSHKDTKAQRREDQGMISGLVKWSLCRDHYFE